MEHIERMKTEKEELIDKIDKLKIFLSNERSNPKFTDAVQRTFMENQLKAMVEYRNFLICRIDYDTIKARG